MNINQVQKLNTIQDTPFTQVTTDNKNVKTEENKNYDSLVQDTRAYSVAFMGKSKKVHPKSDLKILSQDELQVRNALDKLYRNLNKANLEKNEASYDFMANSIEENKKELDEKNEKYNTFFKNEEGYEKFKNLKDIKKIKNPELKDELNIILTLFDNAINPKKEDNTAGENEKLLDKMEIELTMKANQFKPTAKCDNYGDYIAEDLIQLVKQRNKVAKENGFDNYYEMKLQDYGTNSKELRKTFEQVNKAVQNQFDNYVKISPETTKIIESRICKTGLIGIPDKLYEQMGWNISKMPISFDIYPKDNKANNACCCAVDTNKDSRILGNLVPEYDSIKTMLHEIGHAVYNCELGQKLPISQKNPASVAMTEAIAMMMESLPEREGSFDKLLELPKDTRDNLKNSHLSQMSATAKWQIHLSEFERQMYENPDQDLKKLWYNLFNKYYDGEIPEKLDNKWAEIPHYVTQPGYTQNYLRAEIIASQLYDGATKALNSKLTDTKETAKFFNNKVFKFGSSKSENEILKIATGKNLSAEGYCNQFK